MANTALGKVSITPRGAWNAETVYHRLDAVTFGGASWLVLTEGCAGVTPAEGADYALLASGARVDVVSVSGAEVSITLADNTEVRCTDAVTGLEIAGFAPGPAGKAELWSIVFTAGETIAVTVPDTVIWAVAKPVFTPGSTYWISWTPLYGKYLAVWTEVEANESTVV